MLTLVPCITLALHLSAATPVESTLGPYELLVRGSFTYPLRHGSIQVFGFDQEEPHRVTPRDALTPPEDIFWVEPSPHGTRFLYEDREHAFRVWDSRTGSSGPVLAGGSQTGPFGLIGHGIWSPCGDRVALAAWNPSGIVEEGETIESSHVILARPDGSERRDLGVGTPKAFSDCGEFVLIGHGSFISDAFTIIEVSTGRALRSRVSGNPVAMSPDSSRVAVLRGEHLASMDLWVVDSFTDAEVRIDDRISASRYFFHGGAAWRADGQTLLYEKDDRIFRWSSESGRVQVLPIPAAPRLHAGARWVALSPDGRSLLWLRREPITGIGIHASLRIYNLETGDDRALSPGPLPRGDPNRLRFPDGRFARLGGLGEVVWSPNSRVVLLNFVEESYHGLTSPILALNVATGEVAPVTDRSTYLDVVAWRPRR